MIIGKIDNQALNVDNSQNSPKTKSITIDIYKDSVVGKIKDINEEDEDEEEQIKKEKHYNGLVDKYDIIIFFIKYQKYISLINYKLNKNIPLSEFELKIKNILKDKENNLIFKEIKSDLDDDQTIEEIDSKKFKIPYIFYDDINIIKKNNKVKDLDEQIKFDIYNQMEQKVNLSIYEDELKVVYNKYYIRQFYKKVSLGYSMKHDGSICEEGIIGEQKQIIKKKIVMYC